MAHLTPDQFVDIVDGAMAEADVPHVSTCDACRQQLLEMRAMMAEAAEIDVPEPSPVFWDRLSSRVRAEVADDGARSRSWTERLFDARILVPILAGAFAVVMFVVLQPREPFSRQTAPAVAPSPIPSTPLRTAQRSSLPALEPSLPPLGSTDDPQLKLVADFGTALDWDEMRDEVALGAQGAPSDAVLDSLTIDEQRELQRLLADEMGQPTAPENRS